MYLYLRPCLDYKNSDTSKNHSRMGSSTGQFHGGSSFTKRRKSAEEPSGLEHPTGRHGSHTVEACNENSQRICQHPQGYVKRKIQRIDLRESGCFESRRDDPPETKPLFIDHLEACWYTKVKARKDETRLELRLIYTLVTFVPSNRVQ